MERIIGIALTRFLDGYVKDFSSAKFSNWSLNNLGMFISLYLYSFHTFFAYGLPSLLASATGLFCINSPTCNKQLIIVLIIIFNNDHAQLPLPFFKFSEYLSYASSQSLRNK